MTAQTTDHEIQEHFAPNHLYKMETVVQPTINPTAKINRVHGPEPLGSAVYVLELLTATEDWGTLSSLEYLNGGRQGAAFRAPDGLVYKTGVSHTHLNDYDQLMVKALQYGEHLAWTTEWIADNRKMVYVQNYLPVPEYGDVRFPQEHDFPYQVAHDYHRGNVGWDETRQRFVLFDV